MLYFLFKNTSIIMKNKIKLFDPIFDNEELSAVKKTMKSGFWASGAGVKDTGTFERKFQTYTKAKECVAVNSGTAALHLALSSYDLKNKEVILPSLSFVSTAHSIIYNGGKPVFVDIEPKTLCINPDDIEKKISEKTKLILPVHFGGLPCNISKLKKIAKKNNLDLVEDAAHACGATYQGEKIGKHGNLVCFSFHPVKNLAMPTGGLISINDKNHKKLKDLLLAKRWCGITNRKNNSYDVKELGWNYYMNEFSASIGLIQLKKLDKLNKLRKKIAKQYSDELEVDVKMPHDINCSYHFYWILVKNREKFRKNMLKHGIETGTHYKPIHKMSMYKKNIKIQVTDKIANNIVSLPTHPNLTENDINKIIRCVNRFSHE